MFKDRSRDYATAAFRDFALYGKKPGGQVEKEIYQRELAVTLSDDLARKKVSEMKPMIADITAAGEVYAFYRQKQSPVAEALEEIYFCYPATPLKRSDMVMRVRLFSLKKGISERTVYNYLKKARREFAFCRGLQP